MNEPTRFIPGGAPGPGRPKGSVGGRAAAIATIDSIISENGDEFRAALEKEFHKSPVKFWRMFGFPLVPQQLVARTETAPSAGPWISMLEACRLREIEAIARKAGLALPELKPRLARNGAKDDSDLPPIRAQEPRQDPPERDFPAQEERQSRPPFWPSPKQPPAER